VTAVTATPRVHLPFAGRSVDGDLVVIGAATTAPSAAWKVDVAGHRFRADHRRADRSPVEPASYLRIIGHDDHRIGPVARPQGSACDVGPTKQ